MKLTIHHYHHIVNLEDIVAAIDNLTTAVSNLDAVVALAVTALGSQPANNDPAIQAAADQINTISGKIQAALPAAPTP